MRFVLILSICFVLAVASGQEETKEGEQQQSQLTAKSEQAQPSYGYDQQPFVHANAKWFIRTTTTTTSTSTSTTTCTLSTALSCSGRRRRGILGDVEHEEVIAPSKVESMEVTAAPSMRTARKADPQLMFAPPRYGSYPYASPPHAFYPYELYPTFGPYQGYYGPGMFMPYSNNFMIKNKPVAVVEGGDEKLRNFFTLTFTTTSTTFTVSTSTSTPSCSVASTFAQCPTGK